MGRGEIFMNKRELKFTFDLGHGGGSFLDEVFVPGAFGPEKKDSPAQVWCFKIYQEAA
jgi:hypothetical protein